MLPTSTSDRNDRIDNPEVLYECFGNGIREVATKSIYRDEDVDGIIKFSLNSFELHKAVLNFVHTQACGDDFRDDAEFQRLYFQFIVKMDSHIQSYFYHDDPSLAAQNFNYTLDFSLDVGATVLGLKKINADTGWPLRLKKGLAPNGKKLTSSVTNTKRVSFQLAFLILFIIRMYQIVPERLLSTIYSDTTTFLDDYYEFKNFASRSSVDMSLLPPSRLKPRSKMEHFDDGDKIKELSYLIGFGNIFCVIKQENLDSKLYKDFILDFATRVVEGNTSCIVRHWTGSGQTAATDRRELLYRVECERPKVVKNTKSTSPTLETEQSCGALSGNKRKFAEDDKMSSVSTTVKPSAPYLLGNLNTKKNIKLIESKVESIIGSEFKYPTQPKVNTDNISDVDADLLLEIFNPEFPIFGVIDSNYTFTI